MTIRNRQHGAFGDGRLYACIEPSLTKAVAVEQDPRPRPLVSPNTYEYDVCSPSCSQFDRWSNGKSHCVEVCMTARVTYASYPHLLPKKRQDVADRISEEKQGTAAC